MKHDLRFTSNSVKPALTRQRHPFPKLMLTGDENRILCTTGNWASIQTYLQLRWFSTDRFSRSISEAAQTHTAFLSPEASLAWGCIAMYDTGGILPVDTTPQISSRSLCRWRAE